MLELRYEPPRQLDDLLANPLAIEFLKSHCETDRTLENLWFLLDVSWVDELEKAREREESADKRKQIHEVTVNAANAIISRYIGPDAPQMINISSATQKRLREKEGAYERGMFSAAVTEVKMMLNTDILPRFQKSPAYAAMSEALYSVAPAATESDISDASTESGSTAGSILTDDVEDDAGVARVYAQTFKTLHSNFAASSDASMLSLHPFDGSHTINGVLHLEPRKKKDEGSQVDQPSSSAHGSAASSPSSSEASESESSTESSDSSKSSASSKKEEKKEEPVKEDKPKEEKPSKEESPAKEEKPAKEEPAKEEESAKKEEPAKEEEPAKKEEPQKGSEESSDSSSVSSGAVSVSSSSSSASEK